MFRDMLALNCLFNSVLYAPSDVSTNAGSDGGGTGGESGGGSGGGSESAGNGAAPSTDSDTNDSDNSGDDNYFSTLDDRAASDDYDDDDSGEAVVEGEGKGEGEKTETTEQQSQQPQQPETKTEQPQQPQQTEQPQTQQQPEQPQYTPEQWAEQVQKWRDEAEQVLSAQLYAMSDEDVEHLESNPKEAFPRLAARLHVEVMQATLAKAMQMVPQIIENQMSLRQNAQSAEDAFFQKWPKLRDHRGKLGQLAAAYAQTLNGQNPNRDEFVDEVGHFMHAVLRIPLEEQAQAQPTAQPPSPPYTPPGRGRPAPSQPGTKNYYEELAERYDAGEDIGY